MKFLLKYLLQVPLLAFMVIGVETIFSYNYWISSLIGIGSIILYTTGDYIDFDKNDET